MEEGLKKRLIGAAVLASLAVIFVPMLFEEPPSRPPPLPPLPSKPPMRDFASEMLRDEVPAVTPLTPRATRDDEPAAAAADRTRVSVERVVVDPGESRLQVVIRAAGLGFEDGLVGTEEALPEHLFGDGQSLEG